MVVFMMISLMVQCCSTIGSTRNIQADADLLAWKDLNAPTLIGRERRLLKYHWEHPEVSQEHIDYLKTTTSAEGLTQEELAVIGPLQTQEYVERAKSSSSTSSFSSSDVIALLLVMTLVGGMLYSNQNYSYSHSCYNCFSHGQAFIPGSWLNGVYYPGRFVRW